MSCLRGLAALAAAVSTIGAGLGAHQGAAERRVLVTVADQAYRPVKDLTAAAFAVREDGRDGEIVSVAPATEPPTIFVMVDTSAGFQAVARDARDALVSFVQQVHAASPDAAIAIMSHGGPPMMVSAFSKDTASLSRSIRRVIPGRGESFLLESLIEAGRQLERRPGTRRAIVCLTLDNAIEGPPPAPESILRAVRQAATPVWIVALAGGGDPMRDSVLNALVPLSGGGRLSVVNGMAFEVRLRELADLLASQYVVAYRRAAGPAPERLQIGVVGSDLRVFAPAWAPK
jgi:hypothetical protein